MLDNTGAISRTPAARHGSKVLNFFISLSPLLGLKCIRKEIKRQGGKARAKVQGR
jgi:hypothetical protein